MYSYDEYLTHFSKKTQEEISRYKNSVSFEFEFADATIIINELYFLNNGIMICGHHNGLTKGRKAFNNSRLKLQDNLTNIHKCGTSFQYIDNDRFIFCVKPPLDPDAEMLTIHISGVEKSLVPAQPDNNTINPANQTMQRMDDIKFSTKKLEVDLSRFVREKYTGIQTKTNFRIEFSYGTALIEEIRIFEDILCLYVKTPIDIINKISNFELHAILPDGKGNGLFPQVINITDSFYDKMILIYNFRQKSGLNAEMVNKLLEEIQIIDREIFIHQRKKYNMIYS